MRLCLGSSSKWREQIVSRILDENSGGGAAEISTCHPDIDERSIRRDTAEELVLAIAEAKMDAVLHKLRSSGTVLPEFVITSDQVAVTRDGEIREKPVDRDENRRFLRSYSASFVQTVAAIVAYNTTTGASAVGRHRNTVYFNAISEEVIDAVIDRGESMSCCGGFVVEDPALSRCVSRIEGGTVESVQGLDRPTFLAVLRDVGATISA